MSTPGNFIATAASSNFANVIAAVNSGGVNSQNYGTGSSGFESYHIGNQQVVSQHVADSNINLSKIAVSQVFAMHVNYKTQWGGVLGVRYPNPPGYGMCIALASKSWSSSLGTAIHSLNIVFSTDCAYGPPLYSEAPQMLAFAMPVWTGTQSNEHGPAYCQVTAINSVSADIEMQFNGNIGDIRTYYMAFIGPRSI
jgi:hypothetical protein